MHDFQQELHDRIEISELKARYFRAVDMQDWELLESLFIPDAVFTDGKVGAAAFVERSRKFLTGGWSVHHGHTPELCIDGDTATGIWAMEDYIGRSTGDLLHGYGYYSETYVRTSDGWRIASISQSRLRVEHLPRGASVWVTGWAT